MRPILFFLFIIIILLGALAFSSKPLLINRGGNSQAIFDAKGGLLRLKLSSDEKFRLHTPLSEISPYLIEATLLYEDKFFRNHFGCNPFSLLRAVFLTYAGSGNRTGGSTISMQVARLRFAIHSKTILGKLEQIARALQIEWHYSKDEILEAYFTMAPYGANIEGVGAASLIYFSKNPANLTPLEALTLSVIPQNPTMRTPTREINQKVTGPLIQARNRLLHSWISRHPEMQSLHEEASLPLQALQRRELPYRAPHFVDYVIHLDSTTDNIATTLSPDLQALSEATLASFINRRKADGINNASLVLLHWQTMEVRALVGSAEYFDARIQGQVDATLGRRSPGSALKPFIYGLALDQGLIHPQSILKDTPASFSAYDPENFDRQFVGPIHATDALIRSRNLPAIQLANNLSDGGFYALLKKAGIKKLKSSDFYGLALTLGGVEVSLRELVSLYAMLPNQGIIKELRFSNTHESIFTEKRLLTAEAAELLMQMLAENPRPGEIRIEDERRPFPVSWKTGTSFGFRDAWAVGVFGQYVLGVWVGNANGKANPAFIGRDSAGELFFSLVDALRIQRKVEQRARDRTNLSIDSVKVCRVSGEMPGNNCKHTLETKFIPGKSPISTCNIHREVVIDSKTGLRACENQTENTRREVFEFWPSDVLSLFTQAGISRNTPPNFMPQCKGKESFGVPPQIVSPEKGLTYQLRLAHVGTLKTENGLTTDEPVAFKAVTDADTKTLFWFVNEKLVGTSTPEKPFFWTPTPGTFIVRVLDNDGRSDVQELTVETTQ